MRQFHAGRLVDQGTYRSFTPSPLDRPWQIEDMALIRLLGEAERELGRLDMFSGYVPNIDLFIRMHVLKEATQSSRIEGTRTSSRPSTPSSTATAASDACSSPCIW